MTHFILRRTQAILVSLAVVLAGRALASTATQDSFQPVGSLIHDRDGARLTLLTDGTVLVTGGNHCLGNDCTPLASAELFDPKTDQFTAIGAMASPRDDSHTAVRLNDGRVLIAGGSPDYKTQVPETEVYDPSTRAFAPAGNLAEARSSHTATLLLNGQVLLAGGWNSGEGGPTATAELFDPASGKFEKTASMAVARYRHSAVLLPDGRVVILGGYDAANQASRVVEIYDPKTVTFTAAGELVVGRGDLSTALLPNGRILVAGGSAPGQGAKSDVEIYDPAIGRSTVTDTLTDARALPVIATIPDGRVLIAGGYGHVPGMSVVPLRSAEIADPTTGKLTPTASMTVPRAYLSGVGLLDGRVLVLGGDAADGSSLATAEVFVPAGAVSQPLRRDSDVSLHRWAASMVRRPISRGAVLPRGQSLPATMSHCWRIELLGELRVVGAERVLTRFRSRKAGALLAYLAFFPDQDHSRERLIDLLWPGEPPDSARQKLWTALSSLRRQLEPPEVPAGTVIVPTRRTVRLEPTAVTTDVAEFDAVLAAADSAQDVDEQAERLDEALRLHRGPLLPGYYEAWIVPEQQRLDERLGLALHRLIGRLEAAGQCDRALEYARRAVAVDPLRETAQQEFIRLLAATGQVAAARRQYREWERRLQDELGETPPATLQALRDALDRRGFPEKPFGSDLAPAPAEPAPARIAAPTLPPPPLPRTSTAGGGVLPPRLTRFFGREAEIVRIRRLLLAEGARLITLTGPGGSGKTRLALEAAARLTDALDGAVWFVPLVDLLDPARISDSIHAALRLPRQPSVEPLEQIVEVLSPRPALLLLDNFEQLMPEGVPILRELLHRIPSLQCLVTSRRILELAPEREIAVGPLPVPGVQASGRSGVQAFECSVSRADPSDQTDRSAYRTPERPNA